MSKFKVLVAGRGTLLASFESYEEARNIAIKEAKSTGKETCVIEVKSTYSPLIDSYEEATAYLGGDAKNHQKALIALNKLLTIAEAWNKADNFVPDFSDRNQWKWFPWFTYSDDVAGFVSASTSNTASAAFAYYGFWLCFKTSERARQFGEQFIDLWNDFLLYR